MCKGCILHTVFWKRQHCKKMGVVARHGGEGGLAGDAQKLSALPGGKCLLYCTGTVSTWHLSNLPDGVVQMVKFNTGE